MGSDAALDRTQEAMADLFHAPAPWASTVAIVAVSALAGPLLLAVLIVGGGGSGGAASGGLVAVELASAEGLAVAVVVGLALFAAPALLAGALGHAWHRLTGGTAYLRRALLLSLVTVGFQAAVLLVAAATALAGLHAVAGRTVFLLAAAVPLWIRYQAVASTANPRRSRALPDAVSHYVLSVAALWLILPPAAGGVAGVAALAGVFAAVFLAAGAAVVEPMRSLARGDFGADLVALNHAVLAHITEGGLAGRETLEGLFAREGSEGEAELATMAFVRSDGAPKAALVVPGVHPGPFGTLGGSDLPRRLAEAVADVPLVVLHGACTHDLNPVDAAETERVAARTRDLVKRAVDRAAAADGEATARAPGRVPGAALAHPLGDAVLLVHAPAPDPWDDVDASTGRLVEEAATAALGSGPKERRGTDAEDGPDAGFEAARVLVADAHHGAAPGTPSVRYPSARSRALAEAAGDAVRRAVERSAGELRVGLSGRTGLDLADGVGPAGVQCLAVAAGDHVSAYLVFDGNNMVPGLRDALRDVLLERVDEAEVLTSDNHVVNLALDGYNPVGRTVGADRWAPLARELVDEAVDDLEPVACATAGTRVPLRVFGAGTADRISALVHLSRATARRLMRATLVGSLALGAAIALLASAWF